MNLTHEQMVLVSLCIMPLTYGFIGWLTNVIALKMTFYPLKFWGIPPFFGWQGIVPRKSKQLALKSVTMITERLVKLDEFFKHIDPEKIEEMFHPVLHEKIPQIVESIVHEIAPELSDKQIKEIYHYAEKEGSVATIEIATTMRDNISKVFNFNNFVLRSLTGKNVKKIVDIFQEVGEKEFRFIEKSGLYLGFILGCIQATIWLFFPEWWTLPLQGIIVGYLTNYLALNMIFRPLYPKKFGPVKYQGLFLKRQDEVSQKYCEMFGRDILAPGNLMREILYRKVARRIFSSIESALESQITSENKKINIDKLRREHIITIMNNLSESCVKLEKYMARALRIEKMMYARMSELPPEEFEPILRSAFQEDEYVLVVIGAVIGGLVGLAQSLFMLAL